MMESCSAHKLPNSGWMGNLHQLQPRTSRVSSAVCQKLVLWSQARSRAGKRASGSRPGSAPTHHLAVPVRSASAIPPPLRAHRLPGTKNCLCRNLSHDNEFTSAKARCGFHPSIRSLTSRSTLRRGRFRRHSRSSPSPPPSPPTPSQPAFSSRPRLFSIIHSFLVRLTPEERSRSSLHISTRRHIQSTCPVSPSPVRADLSSSFIHPMPPSE